MENKAIGKYIAILENAKKLTEGIMSKLENVTDKINPDDINYGHVGDLLDIESRLSEIFNDLK